MSEYIKTAEKPYIEFITKLAILPRQEPIYEQFGDNCLRITINGLPEEAQFRPYQGEIFRHYVKRQEHQIAIIQQELLIGGLLPYVQISPGSRTSYPDMTGIFFTLPEYSRKEIGVPYSQYYIDFELSADINIIKLENGIYLLPNYNLKLAGSSAAECNHYLKTRENGWKSVDLKRISTGVNIVSSGILES